MSDPRPLLNNRDGRLVLQSEACPSGGHSSVSCLFLERSQRGWGLTLDPPESIASPVSLLPSFVDPAPVAPKAAAAPSSCVLPLTLLLSFATIEQHKPNVSRHFFRQLHLQLVRRRRVHRFLFLRQRDVKRWRQEEGREWMSCGMRRGRGG